MDQRSSFLLAFLLPLIMSAALLVSASPLKPEGLESTLVAAHPDRPPREAFSFRKELVDEVKDVLNALEDKLSKDFDCGKLKPHMKKLISKAKDKLKNQ